MNKYICEFCEGDVKDNQFYYVYAYVLETNKDKYYMGLQKLTTDVADYMMDKPVHLSAGQIILFRPDIMKVFLETKRPDEKVLQFYLQKYVICYECYEEYDKKVPLLQEIAMTKKQLEDIYNKHYAQAGDTQYDYYEWAIGYLLGLLK